MRLPKDKNGTIIQEKVNLYNGIYKKQITEDTFISYIYISFHN